MDEVPVHSRYPIREVGAQSALSSGVVPQDIAMSRTLEVISISSLVDANLGTDGNPAEIHHRSQVKYDKYWFKNV